MALARSEALAGQLEKSPERVPLCFGRLVSILEGGYHLDALADSVTLHVARLLDA